MTRPLLLSFFLLLHVASIAQEVRVNPKPIPTPTLPIPAAIAVTPTPVEQEVRVATKVITFITKVGHYEMFNQRLILDVKEALGDRINFRAIHSRPGGASMAGPALPIIRKGMPWFIYCPIPSQIWLYDGETGVRLTEFKEQGGTRFDDLKSQPNLLSTAPPEFLDRLPPAMRPR